MTLVYNPNVLPQPGSRQGLLIALQVLCVSIALLVYTLRVYTRAFILRSLGSDDYIMGCAMVSRLFSIIPQSTPMTS